MDQNAAQYQRCDIDTQRKLAADRGRNGINEYAKRNLCTLQIGKGHSEHGAIDHRIFRDFLAPLQRRGKQIAADTASKDDAKDDKDAKSRKPGKQMPESIFCALHKFLWMNTGSRQHDRDNCWCLSRMR